MNKRKIVLAAVDIILVIVCIVQIITSKKDNVKIFEYKDEPDSLVISQGGKNLDIVKENDSWFVGEKKYPANENSVNDLIQATKSIRALDKLGKATNEAVINRYELDDSTAVTVVVMKGDKLLRTLKIGKDSSTGVQSYGTIDNGNDVYLLSGNLKNTFDETEDSLRSRIVLGLNKNDITGATVTKADGATWSINRSGEGENLVWSVSGAEIEVDGAKATEWLNSLASLTTPKWYSEKDNLLGAYVSSVNIYCGEAENVIDVYKIPAAIGVEDSKDSYYGKASSTPYPFEIASYSISKFTKNVEELAQ